MLSSLPRHVPAVDLPASKHHHLPKSDHRRDAARLVGELVLVRRHSGKRPIVNDIHLRGEF